MHRQETPLLAICHKCKVVTEKDVEAVIKAFLGGHLQTLRFPPKGDILAQRDQLVRGGNVVIFPGKRYKDGFRWTRSTKKDSIFQIYKLKQPGVNVQPQILKHTIRFTYGSPPVMATLVSYAKSGDEHQSASEVADLQRSVLKSGEPAFQLIPKTRNKSATPQTDGGASRLSDGSDYDAEHIGGFASVHHSANDADYTESVRQMPRNASSSCSGESATNWMYSREKEADGNRIHPDRKLRPNCPSDATSDKMKVESLLNPCHCGSRSAQDCSCRALGARLTAL
ncbi:hypothetical protein F5I97DRAFT_399577 [Phlebopus sp. FC_14]|nr:hypothetical protein F5I97DRAFT_399577 [Phlebopus sp. FC_14]